jgi:hypothetical protein
MAAKKARKRAYIPPSNEVVNRRERSATSRTQRASRPGPARGAGARQQYEYPMPGLKRTARRLPIYFLLIFALQYFLMGQEQQDLSTSQRVASAALVAAFITVLFAPFMHVMDKWAYTRYLRRTGQQQAAQQRSTPKDS